MICYMKHDCLDCKEPKCLLEQPNVKNKGERIRDARRKEKLTQKQLGDILHVSRQTVNNWERNRVTIPYWRYVSIRDYFARRKERKTNADCNS